MNFWTPASASVKTEGVSLDIDILGESDSDDNYFDDAEEETPVSDGTMVFSADDLNANLKTNIFAEETEEDVAEETAEENNEEFDYNYDYDFDFEDEAKKEEVEETEDVAEEPVEVSDDDYFDEKTETAGNGEFKKEDDVFEDVEEEPTEFMGFTTIKSKAKKRGVSSWERTEYKLSERTESIESIRPSANKAKKDNSASDFLSQMAKNLGGEEKVAKKSTAKKTEKKVEKKETTKKAAPKKTAAKTTTKKTTKK